MISGDIIIKYESGLHLRPAKELCSLASNYKCHIEMKYGENVANLKSLIGVLGACVKSNANVTIICSGEDEKEAFDAIMSLLN